MSKARGIHGPSLGARGGKNKQEEAIFTNAHFLGRGGLLCFLLLYGLSCYRVAQRALGGVGKVALEAWVQGMGVGEGRDEEGKQAFH